MQQIGRYRILEEIGRGAMGVVYRAEDPAIGRIIAIKTIRLADAASEEERLFLRERLFREARSAGILSHPNIVTIYDVFEQDGVCYIFMEYVDGPTLDKMIRTDEPIRNDLLLSIIEQTAAALDFAHGKGIVHRDIKPANIMISSSRVVKITDFGIAKFTSQQATNTGVLLGTPGYMSPEQISDARVDGRSDQFSLAVIAYQLITGERPFAAATVPGLMFKIVNEEAQPAQRINATIGPAVDIVLKKAMHKQAGERYTTCSQFAKALAGACDARPDWRPMRQGMIASLETVAEPLPPKPSPAHVRPAVGETTTATFAKRKRSLLWPAAAGFVIALIAARYLLLNNDVKPAAEVAAQPSAATDDATRPSALGPANPTPVPTPSPAATPEPTRPPDPAPIQAPTSRPTARPTPPPAEDSAVRVVTSPPGARIMFDGLPSRICSAPCQLQLAPGRHTLVTMLAGYRDQPRIFNLPQDREIVIALERAFGTLMVGSNPAGASIHVDGNERREKTPAMLTLPIGRHKLLLTKDGRREEQDVDIKDGVVTKIDVAWDK